MKDKNNNEMKIGDYVLISSLPVVGKIDGFGLYHNMKYATLNIPSSSNSITTWHTLDTLTKITEEEAMILILKG